jgi:hypothetical protein
MSKRKPEKMTETEWNRSVGYGRPPRDDNTETEKEKKDIK